MSEKQFLSKISPQAFTSIVEQRASLIKKELVADRNVLYLDVDVVLLSDPFVWLEPGFDIWASLDHPHVFCTGALQSGTSASFGSFVFPV